jgi:hypothetical protein
LVSGFLEVISLLSPFYLNSSIGSEENKFVALLKNVTKVSNGIGRLLHTSPRRCEISAN